MDLLVQCTFCLYSCGWSLFCGLPVLFSYTSDFSFVLCSDSCVHAWMGQYRFERIPFTVRPLSMPHLIPSLPGSCLVRYQATILARCVANTAIAILPRLNGHYIWRRVAATVLPVLPCLRFLHCCCGHHMPPSAAGDLLLPSGRSPCPTRDGRLDGRVLPSFLSAYLVAFLFLLSHAALYIGLPGEAVGTRWMVLSKTLQQRALSSYRSPSFAPFAAAHLRTPAQRLAYRTPRCFTALASPPTFTPLPTPAPRTCRWDTLRAALLQT